MDMNQKRRADGTIKAGRAKTRESTNCEDMFIITTDMTEPLHRCLICVKRLLIINSYLKELAHYKIL